MTWVSIETDILHRHTPSSKIYVKTTKSRLSEKLQMFFESFEKRRDLSSYFFESKEENLRDPVDRDGITRDVHSLLRNVLTGIN